MQLINQFIPSFLLIFCRVTSFLVVSPLFSFRNVPNSFKVGLGFFISMIVFSGMTNQPPPALDVSYMLLIVREIMVGLVIGFTAYLFFTTLQIAGSFIDMQMGFGIVNVIDPMTGAQSPIIGNFKFFIALMLFLAIDGHQMMLLAMMRSYDWLPIGASVFTHVSSGELSNFMLTAFVKIFYFAFQMAAPLVAAMFLVDIALGILAKTVPQFNIFVVGFPLKIAVSFMLLVLLIPGFLFLFQRLFNTMFNSMEQLLSLLSS